MGLALVEPAVPASHRKAFVDTGIERARAPLTLVRREDYRDLGEGDGGQRVRINGLDCIVPLLGPHQALNAATAVAAARVAIKASDEVLRQGLAATYWPGRFQIFPGKPMLVVDGAHNPAAADALRATLQQHFGKQPLTIILGILRDKDCEAFCRSLAPGATEVLTVRVPSERTSNPVELAEVCRRAAPQVPARNANTLAAALEETRHRDGVVVVTGSLYLVGEALALLEGRRVEAGLNQ
ncbi:MAG: hypothetical protein N2689_16460 [Verrucomicrobiae bacterium]|nr:hypothetical protein [Verrucomicrobiae bacterium]